MEPPIMNKSSHSDNDNKMDHIEFDTLVRMQENEKMIVGGPRLGLRGGAGPESSVGGGGAGSTSGWGSPPTGSGGVPNPNVVGSWGVPQNQQQGQPPQVQSQVSSQQSQQAAQVISGGGNGTSNVNQPPMGSAQGPNAGSGQGQQQVQSQQAATQQPQQATANPATKNQLEQLNTMREALFSQDGWGCQHVNQDTNWEVPGSPESNVLKGGGAVDGSGAVWKSNNGTELWEHNLRNGGQPPVPPVQKAQWGHTPSTNLGGTWGEDDDAPDAGNVWTGTPTNPVAASQWGSSAVGGGIGGPPGGAVAPSSGVPGPGAGAVAGGMWQGANAVVKKENDWAGGVPAAGNWAANSLVGGEPREMRAPSADPRLIDHRDQMRGDPRGISGRLNGSTEMWGAGQHQGLGHHGQIGLNKMGAPGGNGAAPGQWSGATLPKDIPMAKPSGWEEPSPPNQRSRFDDGTSLWNQRQQAQQAGRIPGGVGNVGGGAAGGQWKDLSDPINRNMMRSGNAVAGPTPAIQPARGLPLGLKTDAWVPNGGGAGGGGRNGSAWEDGSGGHGMAWDDKMGSQWVDSTFTAWNKNKANPMWPDGGDLSDFGGHGKEPPKMPGSAIGNTDVRAELYRILLQLGHKKDDIELVLRVTNNMEEALELLKQRSNAGMDSWGRHDDHSSSNYDQFPGAGRFPTGQQQPPAMPFPPNNNPAGSGSINPALGAGIGNLQPVQLQKYLSQGPFKQPPPPVHANQQSGTATLRHLVQQIQMACDAGYLNPQILNQPLAPQTLMLLNQLLNFIKQLQQIQSARGNGMQVTKIKQQISTLQNQISTQQAIFMKQQQQRQQPQNNHTVDFLRNHQDPIVPLQGNFADMSINKEPQTFNASQQSRLNQWKLPNTLSNEDSNDFPKSVSGTMSSINDGPWSSGRNISDGWPNSNADGENKDWPNASQQSPDATFTDLVAEFEPGKPWKGSQMKNIEDDPSITPGSIARSPLSVSAAKDSDLFGGISSKPSPTDLSLNLSSSTWSYPNKINNPPTTSGASELWGSSSMSKAARPPPGLGGGGNSTNISVANGWSGGGAGVSNSLQRSISASGNNNTWSDNAGSWGHSNWVLLKNLTPQIDGSTLRTLCMQHGPLQHFHLHLNNSIALCKYTTKEEALKAQMALNNCVLGNTTICAESPSENEVQNILSHLGAPGAVPATSVSSGQTSSWRPNPTAQPGARNSSNSAWPSTTPTTNLWAPLEGGGGIGGNVASERGTPSNLNSYLPETLLNSFLPESTN